MWYDTKPGVVDFKNPYRIPNLMTELYYLTKVNIRIDNRLNHVG